MGFRWTPKVERVYKFALPLVLLSRELVKDKTDAELVQLAKDIQWMDEYNCPCDTFDCKRILAEAIRNERADRHNQRQRAQANSSTAT